MISTDDTDTLKRWAQELNLDFPLLSDASGRVTEEYGVMMPNQKLALRTTYVIDRTGKVQYVEQGRTAVDTTGAATACSRLGKH